MSKFWYYSLMTVIVLHVVIVFVYLLYKLNGPKKKEKKDVKKPIDS